MQILMELAVQFLSAEKLSSTVSNGLFKVVLGFNTKANANPYPSMSKLSPTQIISWWAWSFILKIIFYEIIIKIIFNEIIIKIFKQTQIQENKFWLKLLLKKKKVKLYYEPIYYLTSYIYGIENWVKREPFLIIFFF